MLHIYYGTGKGKTTAAMGLAMRMFGAGKKVLVIQFLKDGDSSEIKVLETLGVNVYYCKLPRMFVDMHDPEMVKEVKSMQESLIDKVSDKFDAIILDEILDAVTLSLLNEGVVVEIITQLKNRCEVVVTGRKPPITISRMADYVTEMKKHKHPYDQGQVARKGIEF